VTLFILCLIEFNPPYLTTISFYNKNKMFRSLNSLSRKQFRSTHL
jgi:hypothetical protein